MTPGVGDIVGQLGGGLFGLFNQGQGGGDADSLLQQILAKLNNSE